MVELIELPKEHTKIDLVSLAESVVRLMKRDIFERFKQTRELSDEDWEFCEKIDWHPIDELPPKKEHIEELKRRLKEETPVRFNSINELIKEK